MITCILFSDEENGLLFGFGEKGIGVITFYDNGTYKLYTEQDMRIFPKECEKELLMLILMKKEEIEILNECRAKKGFDPVKYSGE